MKEICDELGKIVGPEYVSDHPEERYIYSMDPGTMPPQEPDIVVLPNSTDEVRQIMLLANKRQIPVGPLGAGLVLSGLSRALQGGIILDMKRMNRIAEVNEISRQGILTFRLTTSA